jgi:hypothetical protein
MPYNLFGIVLLCRYIVPTVNTSVNNTSSDIGPNREEMVTGERVPDKIRKVGKRGEDCERQPPYRHLFQRNKNAGDKDEWEFQ